MNRKAEGLTITKILGIIIAAFVLAAIVFFVVKSAKTNDNYLNNLPGFDNSKGTLAALEKIRYNITNEVIQYYDGTTWQSIKSGEDVFKLNNKTFSQTDLKKLFNNFFFLTNTRPAKFIVYEDQNYALIPSSIRMSSGDPTGVIGLLWRDQYTRGAVILNAWQKDANGKLVTSLNDYYSLDYQKGLIELTGNEKPSLFKLDSLSSSVPKIVSWRDSVFKKPIALTYKENDKIVSDKKFCLVSLDNSYILADLTKSTSADSC